MWHSAVSLLKFPLTHRSFFAIPNLSAGIFFFHALSRKEDQRVAQPCTNFFVSHCTTFLLVSKLSCLMRAIYYRSKQGSISQLKSITVIVVHSQISLLKVTLSGQEKGFTVSKCYPHQEPSICLFLNYSKALAKKIILEKLDFIVIDLI